MYIALAKCLLMPWEQVTEVQSHLMLGQLSSKMVICAFLSQLWELFKQAALPTAMFICCPSLPHTMTVGAGVTQVFPRIGVTATRHPLPPFPLHLALSFEMD